jgi:hypothetical protein
LRGIGNALGGGHDGEGTWVPGDGGDGGLPDLASTRLEDPEKALTRARAEAAGAVADAEGASRQTGPAAP